MILLNYLPFSIFSLKIRTLALYLYSILHILIISNISIQHRIVRHSHLNQHIQPRTLPGAVWDIKLGASLLSGFHHTRCTTRPFLAHKQGWRLFTSYDSAKISFKSSISSGNIPTVSRSDCSYSSYLPYLPSSANLKTMMV